MAKPTDSYAPYGVTLLGLLLVSMGLLTGPTGRSVELLVKCRNPDDPTRKALGLDVGILPFDATVCATLGVFHDMFSSLLGKGIATCFLALQLPSAAQILSEGMENGWLSALVGVAIIELGQIITIGNAICSVWIPRYWKQFHTKGSSRISATSAKVTLACLIASLVIGAFSGFFNTANPYWPWANIVFQVYPLALLPTVIFSASGQSSANSRARFYNRIANISIVLWWTGLFTMFVDVIPGQHTGAPGPVEFIHSAKTPLLDPAMAAILKSPLGFKFRIRPDLKREFGDGAYFLLFDASAVLLSQIFTVATHTLYGKQKHVSQGSVWLKLAFEAVLGGPGFAFARHLGAQSPNVELSRKLK